LSMQFYYTTLSLYNDIIKSVVVQANVPVNSQGNVP